MEASMRQEILTRLIERNLKTVKQLDQGDFVSHTQHVMVNAFQAGKEAHSRGNDAEAAMWAIELEAWVCVVERYREEMRMMTQGDYRWSLMYVAADKKYRLTETHLEGSEWVISRTSWDLLTAALSYIDRTNKEGSTSQDTLTWTKTKSR
jgi:hypothetical protein